MFAKVNYEKKVKAHDQSRLSPIESLLEAWEHDRHNRRIWQYVRKVEEDIYNVTPGKGQTTTRRVWMENRSFPGRER